uniref:Uncharacterized protein n=1 Tax=Brassica oleracea TaxID=3712 RepID=A0A3P6EAG7_BRAOL|nr:unnamed protein product [Brassica oleracea]
MTTPPLTVASSTTLPQTNPFFSRGYLGPRYLHLPLILSSIHTNP